MKKCTFSWSDKEIISLEEIEKHQSSVKQIHNDMHNKSIYPDSLGWLDLISNYQEETFLEIENLSKEISKYCDYLLVIGVGGSYLGSRAILELLEHKKEVAGAVEVLFLGNNLSGWHWEKIMSKITNKDICVNVISKSGSTLETKLAYNFIEKYLLEKYDLEEVKKRIIITTDENETNPLIKETKEKGYKLIYMQENIGGRYSVFTAVGLLPLAVAGIDIRLILEGAKAAYNDLLTADLKDNQAYQYAVIRNILYENNQNIEVMVSYDPRFRYLAEWWKQLFAESEGKEEKGILPIYAEFTTDLHSFGQYIQDGRKNLFETIIWLEEESIFPEIDQMNMTVKKAVYKAHSQAGIAILEINIPQMTEYYIAYLMYFFQKACAMSALLLGVNPFDQPGVEAYKDELRRLKHSNTVF